MWTKKKVALKIVKASYTLIPEKDVKGQLFPGHPFFLNFICIWIQFLRELNISKKKKKKIVWYIAKYINDYYYYYSDELLFELISFQFDIYKNSFKQNKESLLLWCETWLICINEQHKWRNNLFFSFHCGNNYYCRYLWIIIGRHKWVCCFFFFCFRLWCWRLLWII